MLEGCNAKKVAYQTWSIRRPCLQVVVKAAGYWIG